MADMMRPSVWPADDTELKSMQRLQSQFVLLLLHFVKKVCCFLVGILRAVLLL